MTSRVTWLAAIPVVVAGVAALAIWLLDAGGHGGLRDAGYVLAVVLVPLSVAPAVRASAPGEPDVALHRGSFAVMGIGSFGAVLPPVVYWPGGHVFGSIAVGVAGLVWFCLAWVGVWRTSHLIKDTYGPGGWAPW